MIQRAVADYLRPDNTLIFLEAEGFLLADAGEPGYRFSDWCALIDEDFLFEGVRRYLKHRKPNKKRMIVRERAYHEARQKQRDKYLCGRLARESRGGSK
jgi:hypothetical protein